MTESRLALRPLFVDHSSDLGGAEFALARLLRVDLPWVASLVVPPASDARRDAFTHLPATVQVERIGPIHTSLTTSRYKQLAALTLAWRLVASAASLLRARSLRESNVLVANTTRSGVYVTVIGLLTRKPVVVHIRDMIEPEAIGGLATTLMRRFVLPRAAGLIANSSAALEKVAPYIRASCISSVIASPSGLHPVNPLSVDKSGDLRVVGMVARLDPWKGQDLLLRAFATVFASTEVRLHLVGGPAFGHHAYVSELHQLASSLGIADRVDFLGHTDDVPAAIAAMDVCVQCSTRAEPLGQNVLQYLAAGRATVVADEGGPSEWVVNGENGLTFRARDVEDLGRSLRRLHEDESLRTRLAKAAPTTPGLASDEQVGDEISRLLGKVVSAASDRPQ